MIGLDAIQCMADFGVHLSIEAVHFVRAIECEACDCVAHFKLDECVGHRLIAHLNVVAALHDAEAIGNKRRVSIGRIGGWVAARAVVVRESG